MLTSNFDYYLPQEAIAQKPLEPRDHSRLLVLDLENNKNIEHSYFYNLPNYLKEGDTLVFNDTKVMPARLLGRRDGTGGKVEVFLLNRIAGDDWEVLVKPGKKARPGVRVLFEGKNGYNNEKVKLECEILSITDTGGRVVRFFYDGVFETIIDIVGETPLPPYIKEKLADKNRYQTVYASEQGSAAAPTAGLHFTGKLIDELKGMKVNTAFVTLHVGLGTFRPVNAANITEHIMHREYYSIPEETVKIIENTKKNGGRIIAVGTTAVRALETAGRQAARACLETSNLTNDERFLSQPRQNFAGLVGLCQEILTQDGSKSAVSGRVDSFQTCPKSGWTDIFIYPGYKFRVIDGMITNFHLPKSTLLMLVCALAGREKVLGAYEEAVKQGYRFFSFGDAMLIL